MPIESRIDTRRRLVVTVGEGTLTGDEIRANQQTLPLEPGFDPDFDHLFDVSGVTELDLASNGVEELAAVAIFSNTSRRAVVAPGDTMFGLARMYGSIRDLSESQMRIFRTVREALEWLEKA